MDKYKVIAEKITYSLDGYIADHNNRNFGDADGWLRHVRNGWEEFIEAHPDSLNLHEYLQRQQAKVEELEGKLKQAYEDVDTFAEAHERECGFKAQLAKDKAELQKRVDAVKQLIQDYLDEEKELELKEWEQSTIYGRIAIELEQALKGGGNAKKSNEF
ncbi:hypothetical protein [Acinetobacter baumannii]|uniref:hypothetical protein n=1 Tax=Acinetobacter baumannii TaxID=470 RepID=UPI001D192995|nr:hypothetical protein [Acinetobacter baumannii]